MRVGFLITARLKSSRLPLKLLKNLGNRSVVERVIDRAKRVRYISDVVVCTSTSPQDRPLAEVARENQVFCFNGDGGDVLKRLYDAARFYQLDYFVGITGENPLFSVDLANQMAEKLLTGKYDYVYIKGLPLGCATYGARVDAMELACRVKQVVDTEIWGYLLYQPDFFNLCEIPAQGILNRPDLRVTIDFPEDYQFVNYLYQNLPPASLNNLENVLAFLAEHPEIEEIHKHRKQEYPPASVIDKINSHYQDNKAEILKLKAEIYNGHL